MQGHWYGCYTWHKSLSVPPRPCIMTMNIDGIHVEVYSSKTLGVDSRYLHKLTLTGKGTDDKGSFKISGVLQEVGLSVAIASHLVLLVVFSFHSLDH
jgi:hypothetical protein